MNHEAIIKNFKVYWIVIIAYVFLFLNRLFCSQYFVALEPASYLTIHLVLELFSVIVCFSIALQCFAAYPYTKSERKIFIGVVFLIVGLFDLTHSLIYKGMPLGIETSRSVYFWIMARLTEGFGFLFYVSNLLPTKRTSLQLGAVYSIATFLIIIGWGPHLPPLIDPNDQLTPLKILLELITCLTILISLLITIISYLKNPQVHIRYLICSFFMLLFSELLFTLYNHSYSMDIILGHIYKFLGYSFILRSILVFYIQEPFQKMQASLEYSNQLFQFAPVGLLIMRKSDNQLLQVNNYFREYLKLSDEDPVGKTPFEFCMNQAELHKILGFIEESTIQKKETLTTIENPLVKFGYPNFFTSVSVKSILYDNQDCYLISITDITELTKLHTEMSRLDRLNLIGQMAAGIAHEIRNPMTTVKGYLQLFEEKISDASYQPQKSTIRLMIEELDHANSIITEFLSLAKSNKTDFESLNLNELLQNLYPLIEADAFNQNNALRFIQGDIPQIKLNQKEITQLILNLCRNGLDAMPNGGCLTIETYVKNSVVVLSIQDEGHGIPNHLLSKLGTPFFTTKERGTGLGLAICYKIVESHQGKIDIESSSKGTKFLVSFPIQPSEKPYDPIYAVNTAG